MKLGGIALWDQIGTILASVSNEVGKESYRGRVSFVNTVFPIPNKQHGGKNGMKVFLSATLAITAR